uniref:Uncharacterized protein n=1 Tax=Strigamia maritima TaxID=126957 RepID=T1IS93_STRMM
MLVNQELLALRDRCIKQADQIKQLQIETQNDHDVEKIDKLRELLDRRETEIKHLTKAQKDQDNQLQLMQKKLHAGEELIHSMNLIVNEHKTKCVDDKLELENCKDQLKENVQAVQMLEIEKRQLKKAIQIKESIIQSLMKGDADSSKGMLKNQVVELRLKCEEYENKLSEMNDEVKIMQRSSKDDRSTYSSPKYDLGLMDKNRDLENELKIKQLQLEECVIELNSFRDINYSPGSSSSEMPNSFSRKINEKESKLNATLISLEKITSQLQNKERELKLTKQRCESLEKDYYSVSAQLETVQKLHKMQTPSVDVGQLDSMKSELHKKDKLIRHLQNEMNALQNITLQIEDFQNSIKERDEKIFQLETDLDSEQRLKEERNLAVLTQQNKIKTLQSELDDKDSTIAEMRNAHDENEMSTQYLRTIQANLQTELQEKENQCSVLQLELNKVQNICQEVESGNRTLQCQVEELKNRLEKVTMDKEESDNNVSCLQMELFNLKNELQTTYKSAEKAREKMEHKTNEIVALSVELEKKERHIISQQIQLDKLLRSHEEQDACIHSLMSRLTSLQTDIEEKEKSTGIFSLQPDFLSSKTGLNPKVLQAELWAMKSQLESKEKQLEKARLHLEERDGSIQFLRTLLVTLQNDLEEKEKSLKSVQQQLANAEESVRKQETVNFDLQKQLKSALKENEEKVTKITAALNEVELTHRDQEDKKTRIQNLRSQMHTMQTKLESTLKEKEEKKSTISALRSQIQSLQNKIQMAQKDREDKRACIQALQSELQVLQDEVDVSRKVNDKKEHKIQLLNTQLGAIKLELEEREKIINTLHSEMASLRQSDQEKDSTIDKLTLQLQTAQSKFDSSCLAVQSLQTEVQNLKNISMKEIKETSPTSHNKKNFESYVQMLVSEMESMQYTLQSTQSEWEEKEDAFHAIANHVHKLQAKLEDKKMITNNLEQELSEMTDQTKECRLRCLVMETQLLQDELESKEAALMDATQQLRQSGEQRRRVEQEVSKLLTEMEEIQQGQEKGQQPATPELSSDDRKDGNDDSITSRQLKLQLLQANSRIEILMSDSEEMRNAMEILEFEKLELQESQETLLCENQNLNKKLKSLESSVEQLKNIDNSIANKQACSLCNEYLREIMMLKDLKDTNNLKIKEQELEVIRTNQELNSLTTNLDVQKASLLAITEERDKAVFELSLIERENGNQVSPTETLMFQLEMKAQKETMYARVQEIVSKFVLTVKEHCTLSNDHGLISEKLFFDTESKESEDDNVLRYLITQHQYILDEIIEFKRNAHSKVRNMDESQKSLSLTISNLEADKLQLSQLLNDKISQLEDVLKSLESLTERTLLLEKEKEALMFKSDEKINSLEKQNDEASLALKDKNQLLEENCIKIDAMTKTISSMAVDHKEHCDTLNVKLKQTETEKFELERDLEEVSAKFQVISDKKEELGQNLEVLTVKFDEILDAKNKLAMLLNKELVKVETLDNEMNKVMEELNIKKEELNVKTEELNIKTEELNIKTEELNIKKEELNIKKEELNIKTEELNIKSDELRLKAKEKDMMDDGLVRSKDFFEAGLGDLEMILSDVVLLLKSEGSDWCLFGTPLDNKFTIEKCVFPQFDRSAEKLYHLQHLGIKLKENLNNVLAAHEDNKSELLCTLMQKNQNLQIESEKNEELDNCIVKLNEELMEFKDSLESEKLELVQKHLLEIEEMKGQVESQKQIEENNKVMIDTIGAKIVMLEEEKRELLDNVSQNLKALEHRKAQLSAMKQDLKIMKKEKEQIIGIILVREETIKDLEQKLKKLMSENKQKCETIYRNEQSIHNLEEQLKFLEIEKKRLAEIINNLTEKVADLEDAKVAALERTKKVINLEHKFVSLQNEVKENDKRFENAEKQLRSLLIEQSATFENEKSQLTTKIEDLEERIKEGEYELQREKENHAMDNARKSNCEVDLKEKIDALNVTIQQLQLEKADLLMTTTERISELEEMSCKLEKDVEFGETERQNCLVKLNKLEEEKMLLQQALTEKVEILEKERKVICDQLQDLEKVKNKLMFEVREKEGKIQKVEILEKEKKVICDQLQDLEKVKNKLIIEVREKEGKIQKIEILEKERKVLCDQLQDLEKVKNKLMFEVREKEGKIQTFEETLNDTLEASAELEKAKSKLILELREKEESLKTSLDIQHNLEKSKVKMASDLREKEGKIVGFEERVNELTVANQESDKMKTKLRSEVNEKDEKLLVFEEKFKDLGQELEKLKYKLRLKEEKIITMEDRINKLNSAVEMLERSKSKLVSELHDKDNQCDDLAKCLKEIEQQCEELEEMNKKFGICVNEKDEEIAVLIDKINNLETEIEDLKKMKNALVNELRDKDKRCQDITNKCADVEEGMKKYVSINQELDKEKIELLFELKKKVDELREMEEKLNQVQQSNEQLEKCKMDMISEMCEKEECLKDSWTTNQELEKVKRNLQVEISEKEKELQSTLKMNQELENTKCKFIREIRDKQDQINNFQERLNDTITINQDLEKVKTKYLAQISEKDERIQELENSKSILEQSLENELKNLEAKNDSLEKTINEKEEMIISYEKSNHEHVIANQESSCLIDLLKDTISKLELEKEFAVRAFDDENRRCVDVQRCVETHTATNQKLRSENLELTTIIERMQMSTTKIKEDKDLISLQLASLSEKYSKCLKDIEQLNEMSTTKMMRIETLLNENQRLKDQLQDVEQNVVMLTESKRNLMAEFMLQKEESNKLNEQITDLTLELERRLRHHEAEKGSLDELQTEVDLHSDQLESTDDSYLVLMMFKEKLESQLASATTELAELRDKVNVLQGDGGGTSSPSEQSGEPHMSSSTDQKDFGNSQNPRYDLNDDKNNDQ